MAISDWISLGGVFIAGMGVFVVYSQLQRLSQQITLQSFSEYTKRYQDIILHLSEDINTPDFALAGRADYAQTMRYLLPISIFVSRNGTFIGRNSLALRFGRYGRAA